METLVTADEIPKLLHQHLDSFNWRRDLSDAGLAMLSCQAAVDASDATLAEILRYRSAHYRDMPNTIDGSLPQLRRALQLAQASGSQIQTKLELTMKDAELGSLLQRPDVEVGFELLAITRYAKILGLRDSAMAPKQESYYRGGRKAMRLPYTLSGLIDEARRKVQAWQLDSRRVQPASYSAQHPGIDKDGQLNGPVLMRGQLLARMCEWMLDLEQGGTHTVVTVSRSYLHQLMDVLEDAPGIDQQVKVTVEAHGQSRSMTYQWRLVWQSMDYSTHQITVSSGLGSTTRRAPKALAADVSASCAEYQLRTPQVIEDTHYKYGSPKPDPLEWAPEAPLERVDVHQLLGVQMCPHPSELASWEISGTQQARRCNLCGLKNLQHQPLTIDQLREDHDTWDDDKLQRECAARFALAQRVAQIETTMPDYAQPLEYVT